MSSLTNTLTREIKALLAPVAEAVETQEALDSLLAAVGAVNSGDPSLPAALSAVSAFATQCETLDAQSEPSFESITALLDLGGQAIGAISALADKGGVVAGATGLGEDLAELLVGLWLSRRHPIVHDIGVLLALVQPIWEQKRSPMRVNGDAIVRMPHRIDRIRADRLVDLIRNPVAALRAEYGAPLVTDADAIALADKLFPRVQALLTRFGISSRYGLRAADAAALGDWGPLLAQAFVVYIVNPLGGAEPAGVVVTVSPASRGDLGLVFSPFGPLSFTRTFGRWAVELKATVGIDVAAWGRMGPTLLAGPSSTEMTGSATATLPPSADGAPAVVIGAKDGTRLELGGVQFRGDARVAATGSSLAFSADVMKSALVISGGDGDGFLSSLIPANGLRADFDLGIGWSSDKGVTLRGNAGLQTDFPVSLSVGGVALSHLHLALHAGDAGVDAEISGVLSASIGPVQASVDRMGLAAHLTFPDKGGNLGGANLALGFKPPNGVGVAIDVHGVLTGGGFLTHDEASGNYGGVVQLSLHEKITLTGYGIIGTKMPDGSKGYSLLIFITAEDFGGIQLGFGLVLQSIGGMVGIHRTFDVDVIRSGLRSDMLATLLFPRDPVANAPALLQALASAFPARKGSYLLGLLARITWFTPTLVQADLALILELGARTRLLILGRVSALLPTRDNDLIRLNLDSMGVLDFDAGTFEADAVLVDSRIVHQFPVTGSAAVRARWPVGGNGGASFVLAVGGLNPHFAAPAGFPQLDRVAIAFCAGKNPRLVCDAYLAVTANTVQFGSRTSLYAEAFDFSISGDLSFDALITLLPPHFLIDFHAKVQLKHGSTNLFSVTVDGSLEGPLPLRLSAKATFEILWFSFSVHFNFTLADGPSQAAVPTVVLEAEVTKALTSPASWTTQQEAGLACGVAFRALPAGATPVLDPLGQFAVRQDVAPLNADRAIDTYGGARVAGAQRFQFAASFNGKAGSAVTAAFPPARYFTMSDDDKLAAPSFDTMEAGAVLGDATVAFDAGTIAAAPLEYDEFVLNPADVGLPAKPTAYKMPPEALQAQQASGAAARAPVRNVGRARFRNTEVVPVAMLKTQGWRAAPLAGLTPAIAGRAAAAEVTTWSEGQARLADLDRRGDRWLIVPAYELTAA